MPIHIWNRYFIRTVIYLLFYYSNSFYFSTFANKLWIARVYCDDFVSLNLKISIWVDYFGQILFGRNELISPRVSLHRMYIFEKRVQPDKNWVRNSCGIVPLNSLIFQSNKTGFTQSLSNKKSPFIFIISIKYDFLHHISHDLQYFKARIQIIFLVYYGVYSK